MKTSCDPIEKVPIVQQVSQFTKSTPLALSHNGNHKRQYRESGFVLVRTLPVRRDPEFAPAAKVRNDGHTAQRRGIVANVGSGPHVLLTLMLFHKC